MGHEAWRARSRGGTRPRRPRPPPPRSRSGSRSGASRRGRRRRCRPRSPRPSPPGRRGGSSRARASRGSRRGPGPRPRPPRSPRRPRGRRSAPGRRRACPPRFGSTTRSAPSSSASSRRPLERVGGDHDARPRGSRAAWQDRPSEPTPATSTMLVLVEVEQADAAQARVTGTRKIASSNETSRGISTSRRPRRTRPGPSRTPRTRRRGCSSPGSPVISRTTTRSPGRQPSTPAPTFYDRARDLVAEDSPKGLRPICTRFTSAVETPQHGDATRTSPAPDLGHGDGLDAEVVGAAVDGRPSSSGFARFAMGRTSVPETEAPVLGYPGRRRPTRRRDRLSTGTRRSSHARRPDP